MEDTIDNENTVRALDTFVNGLDMEKLGFKVHFPENGRPAYHPAILLKLYIYGYMNKVRSSRQLEKECKRNIEVMWLLESLAPDHKTKSNFRKDNPRAIKRVFRATVEIARNFGLIGATLIAGDSTKLRAQNSKKNNYNQKKIDRHIAYIDKKLEEYQGRNYYFKQYKTNACKGCPVRELYTTARQNGKIIQRSEFKEYIDQNAKRVAQNQLL